MERTAPGMNNRCKSGQTVNSFKNITGRYSQSHRDNQTNDWSFKSELKQSYSTVLIQMKSANEHTEIIKNTHRQVAETERNKKERYKEIE